MRLCAFSVLIQVSCLLGGQSEFSNLQRDYSTEIVPLFERYCFDCHSEVEPEGDVDLESLGSLDDVRRDIKVWLRVDEMLRTRQMPPNEEEQPSDAEHARLSAWVHDFLTAEARAHAGDPGRVTLRRLSTDEYTYTIRDLTGIASLDPTREFPVDGAAGEGFTNTGDALVMSPSLVSKFLQAGKEVAAHAVLLPDGIRFSPHRSERDWTDEWLDRIRAFYARYTIDGGGASVKLQGIDLALGQGGLVPLAAYFEATLSRRDALRSATISIQDVADDYEINSRYLKTLWEILNGDAEASASVLLAQLQNDWRESGPGDGERLARQVRAWQGSLWKFNSIGHIGTATGPSSWMEGVNPLAESRELRFRLPEPEGEEDVVIYLASNDAGDGDEHDFVLWDNPRLVADDEPPILLRDVVGLASHLTAFKKQAWEKTGDYLAAAAIVQADPAKDLEKLSAEMNLSRAMLDVWFDYLDIDSRPGGFDPVPAGSLLAHWKASSDPGERRELAERIRELTIGEGSEDPRDAILHDHLRRLPDAVTYEALIDGKEKDSRFGVHPEGGEVDASHLVVRAPAVTEFRVPARFARGRELVVTARLEPRTGREGSVQVALAIGGKPSLADLIPDQPILVGQNDRAGARFAAAFDAFRDVFPLALCYTRIVPVDQVVTLTLFYREDASLQRLMLSEIERAELDRLWDELLFLSQHPLKKLVALEQIYQFATQDRPDLVKEFEPMKEPMKARAKAFQQRLLASESVHLQAVLDFAHRAWRRPLSEAEQAQLRVLYRELRENDLGHDSAIRLMLARVLTSPVFLYRLEEPGPGEKPGPVTDLELASRLSYFLWSSQPDAELRELAEAGVLSDERTLLAQTRRMLQDDRIRRLAIQFACQWLHVRNFDQNDEKNEQLYPEFATLRTDMYEETVRFFEDMFRNGGSILDLLEADHTFLNGRLAAHYGIASVSGDSWHRVEQVREQQRGGVLGMATVLASQSGASRTSPILRGNWIYETLLGERLPKPPPTVPQLPETVPEGLTARQLIEQHSSVPECVKCHERIDPYGFALEQYDAIGRLRPEVVDTQTRVLTGQAIEGLDGLRRYLVTERRADVVRQFCKKLLGYALGRAVQLSDQPLLETIGQQLVEEDYSFHRLVERVVLSDQFRNIRGRLAADE